MKLIVPVFLLAGGACATSRAALPLHRHRPALPLEAPLAARLDRIAEEALEDGPIAGMSVLVRRGDEVLLEKGYGDVRAGAVLPIGSLTKIFTAVAIMQLAEEGRLALDDPIARYVDFPTGGQPVTIRHLLTHTSGIKSFTDVDELQRVQSRPHTHEQVLDYVRGAPLAFAPGDRFAYSNTGYFLLGMIVEKASGMPYLDYLAARVFARAALRDTGDCDTRGHAVERGTLVPAAASPSPSVAFAAGELCASAADVGRFFAALTAGQLVARDSVVAMSTPPTLEGGSVGPYGLGLGVDVYGDHRTLSHGGAVRGFSALAVAFPDDGLIVVMLADTESQGTVVLPAALRTARAVLGIGPKEVPLTPAQRAVYTGTFPRDDAPGPLVVFDDGAALAALTPGGTVVRLISIGGDDFVNEVLLGVRYHFVVQGARAVSLQRIVVP
jgi:CubicO group peptidase (beta-lactamase class C family)